MEEEFGLHNTGEGSLGAAIISENESQYSSNWRIKSAYVPRGTSLLKILEVSLSEILSAYMEPLVKQWIKNIHLVLLTILNLWGRFVLKNEGSIPRSACGIGLDEKVKETLSKGEETELMKGFTSKNGKLFDAYLSLDTNGKLKYRFPDKSNNYAYSNLRPKGSINSFGSDLENSIPTILLGVQLSEKNKQALQKGKETELIQGFTSKKGKLFDAFLYLDKENKLKFRFPEKSQKKIDLKVSETGKTINKKDNESLNKIKDEISVEYSNENLNKNSQIKTELKSNLGVEKKFSNQPKKITSEEIPLPKIIFGKTLGPEILKALNQGRETDLISGFLTTSGKEFSAYLKITQSNLIQFRIPSRERDTQITAIPKIIFGVTLSEQNKMSLKRGVETSLILGFEINHKRFDGYLRKDGESILIRTKSLTKSYPIAGISL